MEIAALWCDKDEARAFRIAYEIERFKFAQKARLLRIVGAFPAWM